MISILSADVGNNKVRFVYDNARRMDEKLESRKTE
jgi:hypothetical protein